MSDTRLIDQLDEGIDALLLDGGELPPSDPAVTALLAVAAELRTLPRADFKVQLKSDLLRETLSSAITVGRASVLRTAIAERNTNEPRASEILPTLAGFEYGLYPVQRSSFMASLGAHALMVALLVTSGIWAAPSFHEKASVHSVLVTDLSSYILPPP